MEPVNNDPEDQEREDENHQEFNGDEDDEENKDEEEMRPHEDAHARDKRLMDAKANRKQVEKDAELLKNRIALLQMEERKARKKIEETKKRTNEVLVLKKVRFFLPSAVVFHLNSITKFFYSATNKNTKKKYIKQRKKRRKRCA